MLPAHTEKIVSSIQAVLLGGGLQTKKSVMKTPIQPFKWHGNIDVKLVGKWVFSATWKVIFIF